jgi:hypothetical protein
MERIGIILLLALVLEQTMKIKMIMVGDYENVSIVYCVEAVIAYEPQPIIFTIALSDCNSYSLNIISDTIDYKDIPTCLI